MCLPQDKLLAVGSMTAFTIFIVSRARKEEKLTESKERTGERGVGGGEKKGK